MKPSARDVRAFLRAPDAGRYCALLLYGADPVRVAAHRKDLVTAFLGERGEEEMRLARVSAAEARRGAGVLSDALAEQSFFGGQRVVLLEDAADGVSKAVATALEGWREGDAILVVSAGALAARSSLRKLFEGHKRAAALPIYNDPPGREDVEAALRRVGIENVSRETFSELLALAGSLEPGDFAQTLEKLYLYALSEDEGAVTPDALHAVASAGGEAAVEDVVNAVADAQTNAIGPLMARLRTQGIAPVTLCLGAARHYRALYAAACDPGGVAAGISRARPPVFGPRRERMQRQAAALGVERLQQALTMITDTDLQLRAPAQTAPAMAQAERLMVRLSMLAAAPGRT